MILFALLCRVTNGMTEDCDIDKGNNRIKVECVNVWHDLFAMVDYFVTCAFNIDLLSCSLLKGGENLGRDLQKTQKTSTNAVDKANIGLTVYFIFLFNLFSKKKNSCVVKDNTQTMNGGNGAFELGSPSWRHN